MENIYKLKKGDVVGIVAPSKASGEYELVAQRTKTGVKFLEDLGLQVEFGTHVYDREYFGGASLENRVKDIHEMFKNPKIKMIMMIVGGRMANLILDKLDYDLIKKNPKIFIGMSDGTLLTNAINYKTGLKTFYGINLNDGIGFPSSQKTIDCFKTMFFTNDDVVLKENKELIFSDWKTGEQKIGYDGWNVVRPGVTEGELTGGLLERLVVTDYAGYNIDYENKILFFETVRELKDIPMQISVMKQRGVFNQINALIIGNCNNVPNQKDVADFISDYLSEYDFPIMQIAELGHNVENYVFPVGAKAKLDTVRKEIIIYNK